MFASWGFFWPNILLELASLGLLLIVAVTVSSVRHEPDPKGRRLTATYLAVVMFFSLFTALAGSTAAVASLASLVGGEATGVDVFGSEGRFEEFEEEESFEEEGNEDAVAGAVQGVLLAGLAGAVLLYHRKRFLDLVDEAGDDDISPARVAHAYLYASSLVALLVFVVAASVGLFGFVKVLVPDAVSTQELEVARDEGARQVFAGGFAAVAALAVVGLHRNERERMDEVDADDEDEPPPEPAEADYPIA